MNITWNPRILLRHGTSTLRLGVAYGVAMASLAWTFSGTVVDAQQLKSLQHGGESFAVVPASQAEGLLTMPSLSEPLSDFDSGISQISYHSSHRSRSGNSLFHGQYGDNYSGSQGGMNCPTCDPYIYARVESVLMRREDLDGFSRHGRSSLNDPTFRLDEYDFEFAPRITIGSVPDCVSGYEASFTGRLKWDTSSSAVNLPGFTTLTEIAPGAVGVRGQTDPNVAFVFLYDPADPTNLPNAPIDFQHQRYESRYWTAEASKTAMAWDIAKLLFGVRYIRFDEEYRYLARNGANGQPNANQSGQIYSETTNDLIGLQVGADVFSPICRNTSIYLRARAGGYLNVSDATAVVDNFSITRNENVRLYGMDDDKNHFSANLEIGTGLHYQLGEMLSVQGGAELWYLTDLATAEDQIPSLVGVGAPTRGISKSDDVLFVGFNFGATFKF